MTDQLEAALRQRTQVGNELHAIARAALHLASDIDGLAAAVAHILDHLEAQQSDPDPLDESNHDDRLDRDGSVWRWCDECASAAWETWWTDGHWDHRYHRPRDAGLARIAELNHAYGPLTFAPRPAARPELNVQTALPEQTLHDLPVGTVIRADGAAYVHTDAWEWIETVTGTAWTADELATRHPHWRAIHTPQEPE